MINRIFRSKFLYLIAGLCIAAVGLMHWVNSLGGPSLILDRFGLAAPAVSILILSVVGVTPFPSDLLSIANGAMYGFWLGSFVSWTGWYVAALIQFNIGRSARADFPVDDWMSRLPAQLRRFPVDHPAFLIGARLVPYAGGPISTLIPGALGVSWSRFAWCAALAIVPPSFLMAGIGAGLLSIDALL